MNDDLIGDNGHGRLPAPVLEMRFPPYAQTLPYTFPVRRRPLWPALVLFFLTMLSTLSVGAGFAVLYARNMELFAGDLNPLAMMLIPFRHPGLLPLGIPFSFTLLAILMAHEMGHYFACSYYGIDATYPYFIPAPTLFGTFGAFIRIRSRIPTRRALFDVAVAGPIAGFAIAVPAMAFAVMTSKVIPHVKDSAELVLGNPPLVRIFMELFHPHVNPSWILLNPVGCAAWFGFLATALNLLPAWQLDGGHILYSVASRFHRPITFGLSAVLIVLGKLAWPGWYLWGGLILVLSLRFPHPPVLDQWEPLDSSRRALAIFALLILLLCFTPTPIIGR